MITENMLTLHRQQREEMCRDIELSRAVTVSHETFSFPTGLLKTGFRF